MNIQKGRQTAVMTLVVSLLALFAAFSGLLNKNLYAEVFKSGIISEFIVIGSLAQDYVMVPLGLLLAGLSLAFLKRPGIKVFISILGLTGFFFYGHGLYAIQGQYTSIYLVYLAVFGLSLYSLIWGLTSFGPDVMKSYRLSGVLRKSIGSFLLVIVLVLVPRWLTLINADIARRIPGETYGVFVLDLCVVFPALVIIAVQLWQNRPYGNILAGVALYKVLTVCLSVAFGGWFNSFYRGVQINYTEFFIFAGLTAGSLVLVVLYLINLKQGETQAENT